MAPGATGESGSLAATPSTSHEQRGSTCARAGWAEGVRLLLTDIGLPLESLLWRLFNEDEVRVLPALGLHRGCRCSTDHIRSVLAQFSEEDRAEMRNADGVISVDCEFCSRQFLMDV